MIPKKRATRQSWNRMYSTLNYANKQGCATPLETYKLCNNYLQTLAFLETRLADEKLAWRNKNVQQNAEHNNQSEANSFNGWLNQYQAAES